MQKKYHEYLHPRFQDVFSRFVLKFIMTAKCPGNEVTISLYETCLVEITKWILYGKNGLKWQRNSHQWLYYFEYCKIAQSNFSTAETCSSRNNVQQHQPCGKCKMSATERFYCREFMLIFSHVL